MTTTKATIVLLAVALMLGNLLAEDARPLKLGQKSFSVSDQGNVISYAIRNVQTNTCSSGRKVQEFEYVPANAIRTPDISWRATVYLGQIVHVAKTTIFKFPRRNESDMTELLEQLRAAGKCAGDSLDGLIIRGYSEVNRSPYLEKKSASASERGVFTAALLEHGSSPETGAIYCVMKDNVNQAYYLVSAEMKLADKIGWFAVDESSYLNRAWFNELADIDRQPPKKTRQESARAAASKEKVPELELGMRIDVRDQMVRRKYRMRNFNKQPNSQNIVVFEYTTGSEPKMPEGSEYVNGAAVKDEIVVGTYCGVRSYCANASAEEIARVFTSVAKPYALGVQLALSISGSKDNPPTILERSRALQIAEMTLGKDASEEEKAIEAMRVSNRLDIDKDIFVVIQNGGLSTKHSITWGKNEQGIFFEAMHLTIPAVGMEN